MWIRGGNLRTSRFVSIRHKMFRLCYSFPLYISIDILVTDFRRHFHHLNITNFSYSLSLWYQISFWSIKCNKCVYRVHVDYITYNCEKRSKNIPRTVPLSVTRRRNRPSSTFFRKTNVFVICNAISKYKNAKHIFFFAFFSFVILKIHLFWKIA